VSADPSGWPDPARPGVPLNPERDGWHWLKSPRAFVRPCLWNPRTKTWLERGSVEDMNRAGWCYLGPCPIPDEVAAREAAAELRGRRDGCTLRPELPLEALPPPAGASALAGRIAAARAEGMREAAEIAKLVGDRLHGTAAEDGARECYAAIIRAHVAARISVADERAERDLAAQLKKQIFGETDA
jgi:hypothetical protein